MYKPWRHHFLPASRALHLPPRTAHLTTTAGRQHLLHTCNSTTVPVVFLHTTTTTCLCKITARYLAL